MPPHKNPRRRTTGTTPRTTSRTGPAPPPPPPPQPATAPQFDVNAFGALIAAQVSAAVAAAMAEFSANHGNTGNGNGDNGNGGPGNGTSSSNTGNQGGTPRMCSYKDFTNCKPNAFHGDGGVIALTRWIEKMESVFAICSCPNDCKVKYAACTFADSALSWWNSQVKTMTLDVANAMSWDELKVMMVEEYCPRSEIQNLEQELWNLTMKGSDLTGYTNRFNDLAVLCPAMVEPEYKKVERFIWGLAPEIQGMVVASRPTTFLSAKTIAQRLIDQCVRQGTMEKKSDPPIVGDNKRKNCSKKEGKPHQDPPKKQQTVTVHAVTAPAQPTQYSGNLPRCDKCNFHHTGACRDCTNCRKKGHIARFCKMPAQSANHVGITGVGRTCYECGEAGHFKRDCPRSRNVGGD